MVFLTELNKTAFLLCLNPADPQVLCLQAQTRCRQQVTTGIRQQTEAVNQLNFQLGQFGIAARAGNPFLDREVNVYIRQVIIRKQGRHTQLHLGLALWETFQ